MITDTGLRRGVQHFDISPDAVYFRRPDAKMVLDSIPETRPRHLFAKADIPGILAAHQMDLEVLRRNVEMAYAHGLPDPPRYHEDPKALPYREYFGLHRDYCDRDLVACVASDAHGLHHRSNFLLDAYDHLRLRYSKHYAQCLMYENPMGICCNNDI